MDAEQLIAGTGSPALITDRSWRIVGLNEAARRLLCHAEQPLVGRALPGLLSGNGVSELRLGVLSSLACQGQPLGPLEAELETARNHRTPVRLHTLILPGPQPDELRMVHVIVELERISAAPDPLRSAVDGSILDSLTAREIEVLRMLAHGKSCRSIGESLGLRLATVRNHVQRIYKKLDVHNQLQAAAVAHEVGVRP